MFYNVKIKLLVIYTLENFEFIKSHRISFFFFFFQKSFEIIRQMFELHDPHCTLGKFSMKIHANCLQTFTKFQPSVIKLGKTITLIRSFSNVIRTGEFNILLIIVL